MALCPNPSNPPSPAPTGTETLVLSSDDTVFGDFAIAGIGTRNAGSGTIKLTSIPPGATVEAAYLLLNIYVSNNIAHPTIGFSSPTGGVISIDTGTLSYWLSGSTCWFNPGADPTTYLRNRVYIRTVTAEVTGNGKYTVSGMPVDLAMPIVTDGDRSPGCTSSQGAVLVVIFKYGKDSGPIASTRNKRSVKFYMGSRLISTNPTFGVQPTHSILFDAEFENPNYFVNNSKLGIVAGDTQNSIAGDRFIFNGKNFVGLSANNFFNKNNGPSLSTKVVSASNLSRTRNEAFVMTANDCVNWFAFVASADTGETNKSGQPNPKNQEDAFSPIPCYVESVSKNKDGDAVDIAKDDADFYVFMDESSREGFAGANPPMNQTCKGINGKCWPDPPYYMKVWTERNCEAGVVPLILENSAPFVEQTAVLTNPAIGKPICMDGPFKGTILIGEATTQTFTMINKNGKLEFGPLLAGDATAQSGFVSVEGVVTITFDVPSFEDITLNLTEYSYEKFSSEVMQVPKKEQGPIVPVGTVQECGEKAKTHWYLQRGPVFEGDQPGISGISGMKKMHRIGDCITLIAPKESLRKLMRDSTRKAPGQQRPQQGRPNGRIRR